ncbi:uncharacterized protein M421DRAFT_297255 [Didymella exigua CBS 183.55]|uniref:Secreted protein n=1 Tax=Didymella exigua CBS 183.55 TaxID=1150837 RepID=A0A6A5RA49_9PLEO|nr:uncharacterized protein M421DRAFT_297255 [Didymella exigua CBS 183.55]KAF1924209.1 hypothetical protein M421DRAFT_297255 [Didymella exigua CBS 183.55]
MYKLDCKCLLFPILQGLCVWFYCPGSRYEHRSARLVPAPSPDIRSWHPRQWPFQRVINTRTEDNLEVQHGLLLRCGLVRHDQAQRLFTGPADCWHSPSPRSHPASCRTADNSTSRYRESCYCRRRILWRLGCSNTLPCAHLSLLNVSHQLALLLPLRHHFNPICSLYLRIPRNG